MILRFFIYFVFIHIFIVYNIVNCFGMRDSVDLTNGTENQDFLDIILDNTHAYSYLNYTDKWSMRRSIYTSLMPKSNATRKNLEGIERFPVILDCLLNYEKMEFSMDEIPETLSLKELVSAFLFAIYYLFSNFIETADEGKIVHDQPIRREIKILKRFYLTPEQSRKAKEVIDKKIIESYRGNVVYDALKYNCVDYVKDIYMAIGLDKTEGEFISQFENLSKMNKECGSAFNLLKIYETHSNGDIGPLKIARAIWTGIRMLSLT